MKFREIKIFPDKQKLKGFISTRLALQKTSKNNNYKNAKGSSSGRTGRTLGS